MSLPELSGEYKELTQNLFVESDKEFLASLGCSFDTDSEAPTSLDHLNELMDIAFDPVRIENGELEIEAPNAANEFFSYFSKLESLTREALIKHDDWTITSKSIVGVLRLIHDLEGVNVVSALNSYPQLLGIDPDICKSRIDNIESAGIKIDRVINKFSPALGITSEKLNDKLSELTNLGLNARHVVTVYPSVLGMSITEIKSVLEGFKLIGLDATKIIDDEPNMLRPNKIAHSKIKMSYLNRLGINAVIAINNFPPILTSMSTESVKKKIDDLRAIHVGAIAMMNKFPRFALTIPIKDFKDAQDKFSKQGLNANQMIECNPALANKPEESIILRKDELAHMGLNPITVLNGYPSLLNISSKTLKFRYRVLLSTARAWGVENYSLVTNDIIEQYPALLSYTSDRIRILARILSQSLKRGSELEISQIQNLVRFKLEPTIAGYLEAKESFPIQAEEIVKQSARHLKTDKTRLLSIIHDKKYASDPVVKRFVRSMEGHKLTTDHQEPN